ncbi:hypothetical protein DEM34_11590 [Spiribacter halobius]|uniref:Uncharacterized protein n=1 Tax=Sediminicurvatus halobius TaxID=2182432 RepID=A0A2U2N0N3_9GAMM|nr:hypothetical protein DEM34_11590 [Spiribacter halobius]
MPPAEPRSGGWRLDLSAVSRLDSAGALLLASVRERLGGAALAGAHPAHEALLGIVAEHDRPPARPPRRPRGLEALGRRTVKAAGEGMRFLDFVGDVSVESAGRLARPGRVRWRQVVHEIERAGVTALPITGLLAFLMGIVMAYQGGTTLAAYGASIYLVDLIGITMARELGPLLAAIIVAGRTGSAYAAQIGTMRLTEELDALRSLGITPTEMLILPKLLALVVSLPLLALWSGGAGVLGGMLVAERFHGISVVTFLERLPDAVPAGMYWAGLAKAPVFAVLITLVGCHQGMSVSGSAESVGAATTQAVVQSIFLVIVADAIFSIAYQQIGL